MSFWSNLFGTNDSSKKAMPYLDQARAQYNPYQQQGQNAYNQLNPMVSEMAQDPSAFYENLIKNYEPSKAYNLRRDEALNAASATAAAGGRRGTPQDMMDQARITDSLLGEDMQQWYNNILGLQDRGMQGLGNFYNTGYDATNNIANVLNSQGSLAFQGQAQKNANTQNLWSNAMKAAGAIAGMASGNPFAALGLFGGNGGYSGDMNMFGNMPSAGKRLF